MMPKSSLGISLFSDCRRLTDCPGLGIAGTPVGEEFPASALGIGYGLVSLSYKWKVYTVLVSGKVHRYLPANKAPVLGGS